MNYSTLHQHRADMSVCLQLVLEGIAVTIRSMCNVLLVILVVWLFFNINGVELFAGRFLYCYNETAETIYSSYDVNNKTECLTLINENFTEVHWKNLKINFDDVGGGYLALLQVVSVETRSHFPHFCCTRCTMTMNPSQFFSKE